MHILLVRSHCPRLNVTFKSALALDFVHINPVALLRPRHNVVSVNSACVNAETVGIEAIVVIESASSEEASHGSSS